MGWGSSSKAPKAPDYAAQARATALGQQQAQTAADWANRPTVETPFGTESWTSQAVVDPATGQTVNKWTQTQSFNPEVQAALQAQQSVEAGRSNLALGQMDQVRQALATPFDWNNLQAFGNVNQQNIDPSQFMTGGGGQGILSGLSGAGQGIMGQLDPSLFGDAGRQRYENALFARMAPQHEQAQAALDAKLANMGATVGGRGWQSMNQQLADAQSRERFNALEMGGQEQQRQMQMALQGGQFQNAAQQQGWQQALQGGQFQNAAQQQAFEQMMGQNAQNYGLMSGANAQNFEQQLQAANYQNQLRNQQVQEQQLRRQMPLNELTALLSGTQVGQFQTPNFNQSRAAGATDYMGAANAQYNAASDAYNAQQANTQSRNTAVAGIASAALMAF